MGLLSLVVVLIAFIVVSVVLGFFYPILILNENQILYFYSTGSQIVGAFLGLTLAGYAFLINDLDRQSKDDDSLAEIVSRIKTKNYQLVFFLVFIGALSIVLSLFVIAAESTPERYQQIAIFLNLAGSISVVEIIAIFYFVLEMLEPKKIEKTSDQIKGTYLSSISRSQDSSAETTKDRFTEFMRLFNELEEQFQKYSRYTIKGKVGFTANAIDERRRMSARQGVRSLFSNGIIDESLYIRVNDLVGFRNSLVHGSDFSVSESTLEEARELVDIVRNIVAELRPKRQKW